jgi:hypothetical protein
MILSTCGRERGWERVVERSKGERSEEMGMVVQGILHRAHFLMATWKRLRGRGNPRVRIDPHPE